MGFSPLSLSGGEFLSPAATALSRGAVTKRAPVRLLATIFDTSKQSRVSSRENDLASLRSSTLIE